MVTTTLIDQLDYTRFFHRCILLNLQYWQDYVTNRPEDVVALNEERDRIVKAILFALDFQVAWPLARDLIIKFSTYMERGGHWQTWSRLLDQAIISAHQIEDVTGEITLSALFARLLQRQSQTQQAIVYHRRTIAMARRIGHRFEEARALTNLGYLFIEQDHWSRAEVLCCRALTIFEAINNQHGQAHTHNHLGILYTRQHHWDQARRHLEWACRIWRTAKDDHGLMYGLINLGRLYIEMGCLDASLNCLTEALQQARLTGEASYIGLIYINMSVAYRLKQRLDKAEIHAQQAEALFHHFTDRLGLAQAWCNLGLIYVEQGQDLAAGRYLAAALERFRELKNRDGQIEAMVGLIRHELALGNEQEADSRQAELEQFIDWHGGVEYLEGLKERLEKYRQHDGERGAEADRRRCGELYNYA